jgi:indolepyruvate decarboxylase
LVNRLTEIGIRHLFGVPGDFNLVFLDAVVAHPRVRWIGNANELNAAYAADGYARCRGAAALLTTFGVGELSAINGLAGSYAEYLPVLQIVGAPSTRSQQRREVLHHTLGNGEFRQFSRMHEEITVARAHLTADNAIEEIDRVISEMLLHRRPGYIVLPTDVSNTLIAAAAPLQLTQPRCDSRQLAAFRAHAWKLLAASTSTAVLCDFLVDRFAAADALQKLISQRGLSYATMLLGKGMLDDSSANFIGTYVGAASEDGICETIEQADTLIAAGVLFTDVLTAGFSHRIRLDRLIDLQPFHARVAGKEYRDIPLRTALLELSEIVAALPRPCVRPARAAVEGCAPSCEAAESTRLTQRDLWNRIQRFLRAGDVVVAEQGTSFFGIGPKRLPANVKFLGQPLWGSIGYAIPAAFGAGTALPGRRLIVLVGDGSALMSAQEIGTMLRDGLKPIVILLNNHGYTVERAIHGAQQLYNDIPHWDWQLLPRALGAGCRSLSLRVSTIEELNRALAEADDSDSLVMLEVILSKDDVPELLATITRGVAAVNGSAAREQLACPPQGQPTSSEHPRQYPGAQPRRF